jgi:hypothetical protein
MTRDEWTAVQSVAAPPLTQIRKWPTPNFRLVSQHYRPEAIALIVGASEFIGVARVPR